MASFETYQAIAVQQAFAYMQYHGDREPRCAAACEMVLHSDGAVDPKKLLKTALNTCSASFLRRLLAKNPSYIHMVFDDGSRPMHIAAESYMDGLEKCKMLSLTDLAARNNKNRTPLDCFLFMWHQDCFEYLELCRWMMEQPQCCLDTVFVKSFIAGKRWGPKLQQMLEDAMPARRWTPARAAWFVAVLLL